MNLIRRNALKLLELMVNSKENHFENIWFKDKSGLSPQDINDAIFYLEEDGAVKVMKAQGTASFEFLEAYLTSRGKYLYSQCELCQMVSS